jgi:hypothetical protein
MRTDILRSVKGGYTKTSVLTKIDALNALRFMAEDGKVAPDKIRAELDRVSAIELVHEKAGFFGRYGFDTEDTDAYIAKLEAEIEEKLR